MALLTPDQARDLVRWAGGQSKAADEIGVHRSTLRAWLDPEANRRNVARYYRANAEAERQRRRDHYHSLTGLEYNRLLLRIRRNKALKRRAKREQRRAA